MTSKMSWNLKHGGITASCLGMFFLACLLVWPVLAQESDAERQMEERIDLLHSLAEAHFERANLLSEQGKVDAAIGELEKIKALPFPKSEEIEGQLFEINARMVEMYLEADRPQDAEKLARESLAGQEDPRRLAALHNLLGHCLRAQDRTDEALEQFNLAIEQATRALEATGG